MHHPQDQAALPLTARRLGWLLLCGCLCMPLVACIPSSRSRRARRAPRIPLRTLVQQVRTGQPWERLNALEALRSRRLARSVYPVLAAALCDEVYWVRFAAVVALRPRRRRAFATLRKTLSHRDHRCRQNAAYILQAGSLGIVSGLEQAEAALFRMLTAKHPQERAQAAATLGRIGQSERRVQAALLRVLAQDRSRLVRREALDGLSALGLHNQRLIDSLLLAMHKRRLPSTEILDAFVRLGSASAPFLLRAWRSQKHILRRRALQALVRLRYLRSAAGEAILLQAVADPHWQIRQEGLYTIRRLGLGGKRVLRILRKMVRDSSWRVRREAVYVLWRMKGEEARIQALLWARFKDRHPKVRRDALFALTQRRLRRKRWTRKKLKAALQHKDWRVQLLAATTLAYFQPARLAKAPALAALGNHTRWQLRRALARSLRHVGAKVASVQPILQQLLLDPKWQVRAQVMRTLAYIGPDASVLATALKALPDETHASVRLARVKALRWLILAQAEMRPLLFAAVQDKDWRVRVQAHKSIGALRQYLEEAIPALLTGLKDKHTLVQKASAQALARLGQDLRKHQSQSRMAYMRLRLVELALAPLQEALKGTPTLQRYAAQTLGSMGKYAQSAAPQLKRMLRHRLSSVRLAAMGALCQLQLPPSNLQGMFLAQFQRAKHPREIRRTLKQLGQCKPALLLPPALLARLLLHPSRKVRLQTIRTLKGRKKFDPTVLSALLMGMTSPHKQERLLLETTLHSLTQLDPSATSLLTKVLRSPRRSVKRMALFLLARCGPRGLAHIRKFLRYPHHGVLRISAVFVLMQLGSRAVPALPELRMLLKDRDPRLQRIAAQTIEKLGSAASLARKELADLLRSEYDPVRVSAAKALGALGFAATPVLAEIVNGLQDPATAVRLAIVQTLGKLGQSARIARIQLYRALRDPSPQVVLATIQTLLLLERGRYNPQVTRQQLGLLRRHRNPNIRQAAQKAVKTLQTKTR